MASRLRSEVKAPWQLRATLPLRVLSGSCDLFPATIAFVDSNPGLLSIKSGTNFYTLHLRANGWMAADMVQYLGDVAAARDREAAILKLLGYTMTISTTAPTRAGDSWVIVDLDSRNLDTNSPIIRRAVDQEPPDEDWPVSQGSLERIHAFLDRHDFTVKLY